MAEENKEVQNNPVVSSAEVEFEVLKERANQTFQKYRTVIMAIIALVVVGGGGYYIYQVWFKAPKELAAKEAIYQAQRYFEIDSFQVALDGKEGQFSGMLDIISEYGGTGSANLAHYYAGASYLYLGNFDQAITFLSGYSGGDDYTQAAAYAMLGDAYSEQGNMDEAISQYEKAANTAPNEAMAPFFLRKAGLACEHTQKNDQAKTFYERIEKEYPKSADMLGIQKDIIRVTGSY